MAYCDQISVPAHPNIYTGDNSRELRIEYAIPSVGTNEDTGLLILVPGFGAHIDSKVYIKMRKEFADMYNLVVVQCDYFGNRFMQNNDLIEYNSKDFIGKVTNEDLNILMRDPGDIYKVIAKYQNGFEVDAAVDEGPHEFVDFSYMQAIDILTVIEVMKIILNENKLLFNSKKIIGYGHSQGAYLLHFANRLAPHVFQYIFDNSAWVIPTYLLESRYVNKFYGSSVLQIKYNYIASEFFENKGIFSLHNIYKEFQNGAYIYSLLGTTDDLVDLEDKRDSIKHLKYIDFEVIDESKVDGEVFKSTDHGLNADFLKAFEYLYHKMIPHENLNTIKLYSVFENGSTKLAIDYSGNLPMFEFID